MPKVSQALWRFVVAIYERETIRRLCLDWQNRYGVDVCLLLALVWLGSLGKKISQAQLQQLDKSIAQWRDHVIVPMRDLRQYIGSLKQQVSQSEQDQDQDKFKLYEQSKTLELEFERYALGLLADCAIKIGVVDGNELARRMAERDNIESSIARNGLILETAAIRENLRTYAAAFVGMSGRGFDHDCDDFVTALTES